MITVKDFLEKITNPDRIKIVKGEAIVYMLTNFNSTFEEDIHRVYTIRDIGMTPYVMIYQKETTNITDPVRRLQSWVNNKRIWYKNPNMKFEDFNRAKNRK